MMQKCCENCKHVTYYWWREGNSITEVQGCFGHHHTSLGGKKYCEHYEEVTE